MVLFLDVWSLLLSNVKYLFIFNKEFSLWDPYWFKPIQCLYKISHIHLINFGIKRGLSPVFSPNTNVYMYIAIKRSRNKSYLGVCSEVPLGFVVGFYLLDGVA